MIVGVDWLLCATNLSLSAVATHGTEGDIASSEGRGPECGRTESDGGHNCLCLCLRRGDGGVVNLGLDLSGEKTVG